MNQAGRACLQSREEAGHDERAFGEAQARRHIARHAEVWVLVDGAWYEAANVLALPENVGEGRGEGWGGLRGWEGDLANVVLALEAEDGSDRVEGDTPGHRRMLLKLESSDDLPRRL